jgi:apolipoprotein N-acyltransferase
LGVSTVVDPAGRLVALTEPFREAALEVPVRWMRPEASGYEIGATGPGGATLLLDDRYFESYMPAPGSSFAGEAV